MADGEANPATVPVAVSPVPFHSREPRLLEVREGMTVRAALVEAVRAGILPVDDLRRVLPRTRVMVNGEELDRETALDTRLAADDIVNFEVVELGGGSGSKDIGQVLLTIATVAVSAWIGSMVMFPTMVRAVASAAIMAGGNALAAALFAPEKGSAKVNDRYALQSASNQYRPWAPFPMALGEVVVAPDLVVKTFTRNVGAEVWIHGILGLHYGACDVEEEKIGDTLISSMGAGEVQLVKHLTPGPRTFTLYPHDVDQLDLTGELEATTSSATPIVRASSSEGERFDFHFFFAGGLYFQKDDGRVLTASVTLSVRYREVDENGDPVGGGAWTTGPSWPVSSTSKEPLRITRGISLPMGRYEFEVKRSVKPDDNDKRRDRVVWSALQSIAYRKPVVDETLSLIEFAVKATSLNQGTLAPITCRIKPKFPTWTGTEWGPETTSSNPAAVARWLLTGPAPAKPLNPSEADVRLREWSALCDTYGWRVGVYLQDEKTQSEALGLLERSGRASLFWDGTQIAASTWVEKPAPRQLFAGDNLRDHQWRIVYPEPVHALRVEFQNIDEGGEPDEVYVYADGYGETAGPGVQAASLVEALRIDGQMTAERAYKDGRWALAARLHQRRVDTWTAPVEHLVSGYGDRVRLAWSRVDGGFDARVRCRRWSGGMVSGLRLSRPVEMVPGESYALDLRLTSGVATSVAIINPAVSDPVVTREVFFADPRPEAAAPRAGDKVAFGVPTRISEDVELIGIEPGEDLTAALTGIRYVAPLLMAAETGPVPPLQTRLSRQRAANPPTPRLLGVQPDPAGVRVSFDMPPWSGSPISGFSARWRPTPPDGLETTWQTLPTVPAAGRELITPPARALPTPVDLDDESLIDIEIRAITEAGQSSPTPLSITGLAVKDVPFKPTNVTVTPTVRTAPDGSSHGVLVFSADPLEAAVATDCLVEVRRYDPVSGTPDAWESAGLPLSSINPVGDILGLRAGTDYGVRAAWRTSAGWPSEWTDEIVETVPAGSNVAGEVSPIIPANVAGTPTLSIFTAIAPDGTQISRLSADWTDAASAVEYLLDIEQDGLSSVGLVPGSEVRDMIVRTGPSYRVRAKGVSRTGHPSASWSNWSATVAAGGDTTAPGPVTGASLTPLARRIVVSWTNPTDADFDRVLLFRNNTGAGPVIGDLYWQGKASIYPDTNVTAGVAYHYWLATVDRSGNTTAAQYVGFTTPNFVSIGGGDVQYNDGDLVTQYGISAGFTGQGSFATRNSLGIFETTDRPLVLQEGYFDGGGFWYADAVRNSGVSLNNRWPQENGANVTESRTAAAIVGQAAWATLGLPTARIANLGDTGLLSAEYAYYPDVGSVASLRPGEFGANKTETRTAAAIAGQAATATSSDFAVITGSTRPADNAGTTVEMYPLGAGVVVRGNRVTRNSGSGSWGEGAISTNALSGSCSVSGRPTNSSQVTMIGLTDSAPDAHYDYLDYAIYCASDGALHIYESGNYIGALGVNYYAGLELRITYDGTRVIYTLNGSVVRTVVTTAGRRFWAMLSLGTYGGEGYYDLQFGPAQQAARLGSNVFSEAGTTSYGSPQLVTDQGTAAAITNQGPGATAPANRVLNDRYDGGVRYINYPDGGQYAPGAIESGQLQIVLPYGTNDAGTYSMVRFTVDIYDYEVSRTVSYTVGGYIYFDGVGRWINHSASYIGPREFARPVKFGFFLGRAYVWIGNVGDPWSYPSVRIRDVQVSYSGAAATGWSSGWSVTMNNTDVSSLVYVSVPVPRAGDAVFGEGVIEVNGGAVATLPNFKTQLGAAAAVIGQGNLMTTTLPEYASLSAAKSAGLTAGKTFKNTSTGLPEAVPEDAASATAVAKVFNGSAGQTQVSSSAHTIGSGAVLDLSLAFNGGTLNANTSWVGTLTLEEYNAGSGWRTAGTVEVVLPSNGLDQGGGVYGCDGGSASMRVTGTRTGTVTYRVTLARTGGSSFVAGTTISGHVLVTPIT